MGMWEAIIVAVVGGLVVVAVAKLFTVSAPRVRGGYSRWRHRRAAKAATRKAARKQAEQQRDRRVRIAAAEAEGRRVPVSHHTGRRPVKVTFNDGTVSYHFCGDWQAYQTAMRSGRYDLRRTFHTDPPALI